MFGNTGRDPNASLRTRRALDVLSTIKASLQNIAALTGTGFVSRVGNDQFQTRSITVPAAGLSITNADGVAGNPTLALANDLAAYEGLSTHGIVVRSADNAAVTRTIVGTANQITVTNGDGTAGNITLATPQNINSAATPTFAGLTITSIISASGTSVTLTDAVNLVCGSTTGTKLGTATTQKIAMHGATPVVQRSGAVQAAVATTASTSTTPFGYTTQAQADAIVALVNEIRAALVEKGIIKGSA